MSPYNTPADIANSIALYKRIGARRAIEGLLVAQRFANGSDSTDQSGKHSSTATVSRIGLVPDRSGQKLNVYQLCQNFYINRNRIRS